MSRVSNQFDISVPKFGYNFVDGAHFEILEDTDSKYEVAFIDKSTSTEKYRSQISGMSWSKPSTKYWVDWQIKLIDHFGNVLSSIDLDLTDKRVYIALESKALGDTLAWFPYVEEFRKKHNCKVICSTFWNSLLSDTYPMVEFVSPGIPVQELYALYRIGWFYDGDSVNLDENPTDFKMWPLQKTASDILGLDYTEIKPILTYPKKERLKKIGLGINSTTQAKYWNNPTGWQDVVDWLISNGYEPIILSSEEDNYMGNKYPTGATRFPAGSIQKVIDELAECAAFIGISSGLTWLAWATETPTIQISGFTEPFNEPDKGIIKISAPAGTCSGCANRLRLDAGDWNWCPDHKGTARQFECSKLITSSQVINKLEELLM
jgi:autotransporter strand-loop-strand O-heptosyltransferase